ncbi:aldose 1-epimerase [Streptomyces smyrnaeus]|uniref:Aldose 1-epimerase n=1 Tax=Streptomyces smyrnaeus TaxID=1387713 RepID=A0ABS3XQT1_9ACTN|nr:MULTISPECIES: aldose epimerase [Streptomyces]MBO8197648.1 aldose 1-epimerase [Streptomyces smyrnaeus]MBQ0864566.1 aldose 1-epimerase [Streptomyces sp. RK75]MBQ1120835.1 aldose 1-epimerase [Streptomyces sp. B15]MBQ1158514.1 aldose 1-epimerase [Streptomyces sp. A73]
MTDLPTSAEATSVVLGAQGTEVTVEPQRGCRLASLRVGGTELLRQGPKYGSFVMAPWCGRTAQGRFRNGGEMFQLPLNNRPHAIHGTVRDAVWRQAPGATGTKASFTYELTDPWPWEGRVTQVVELAEDGGSLTLKLAVETFDVSFPAQAGWHPWFLRNLGQGGEDVRIDFSPEWQEERGADHIPTGTRIEPRPGPWDDCFGMPGGVDVTLTWPSELSLRMTSRAEYVVVYDEPEEAVCVEPQSGPPNGLNSHPRQVTPIDPLELTTTWSWQRL